MTAIKAWIALTATAVTLGACASPYDGNYAYSTDSYRYGPGYSYNYPSGYYTPGYGYYGSGYYGGYPSGAYGSGVTIAASF
jgi:hypothetical protein